MKKVTPQVLPGTAEYSDSEYESESDSNDLQPSQANQFGPVSGEAPLSDSESEEETEASPISSKNTYVSSSSMNRSTALCGVQQGEMQSDTKKVKPSGNTFKNVIRPGIAVSDDESEVDDPKSLQPHENGIQPGTVESESENSDSEPEQIIHTKPSKSHPTSNVSAEMASTENIEVEFQDFLTKMSKDCSTPPVQNPPIKDTFKLPSVILDSYHQQRLQPHTYEKMLRKKTERILKHDPITFVCCVCTENYYKTDLYGKCSDAFNKSKNNKIHTICRPCLIQATYPENVSLDQQGRGVRCPTGDCDNIVLISEVQNFMEEKHREQLIERLGTLSIAAAELSDFYRCPDCSYPVIADNEKPFYECPECKRSNCKNCERPYAGDHVNRTCQELIEYEEQQVKNRAVAAARVDEVAVHRCHRCNLQFVKEGGCNKMTCNCGATQCYLCRAKDINYNHFGENKPCQLFSDAYAIENHRIEEERRRQGLND